MRRISILILALALGLSGCLPAGPTPMSDEQMQTAVAATLTAQPTAIIFPPTWTPFLTPTPFPSFTPRPTFTPLPSFTPRPTLAPTDTPIPGHFVVTGRGSTAATDPFELPAGAYRFNWAYGGAPGEAEKLQAINAVHAKYVAEIETWYKDQTAYYKRLKNMMLNIDNTSGADKMQKMLDEVDKVYKQKIATEHDRWEADREPYITTFMVILNQQSAPRPIMLGKSIGPADGSAGWRVDGGLDYYLKVDASGPWTVTVSLSRPGTPPPTP